MLKPPIYASPSVQEYNPVIADNIDVLPAPLGPNKPNISPYYTAIQKFFTAILF